MTIDPMSFVLGVVLGGVAGVVLFAVALTLFAKTVQADDEKRAEESE